MEISEILTKKITLLGQYWKFSKGGNLVNKSGKWQYASIKWAIPEENSEGRITDLSSGKSLGLIDDSAAKDSLVILEEKSDGEIVAGQKWLRGKVNPEGWFMLINPTSNKVMTVESKTTTTLKGFSTFGLLI